jgi:hypothetical protein
MTERAVRLITFAVALAILIAGTAYALARPVTYSSGATLVLTPNPDDPGDQPTLLDSFERSGTVGTYVELLASEDTLKRAGDPDITLTVRAIPGSRALRLTSTGDEDRVKAGLQAVIKTAQTSDTGLGLDDLWTLRVLEAPSDPAESGPNTLFILIATGLLALLGMIVTRVVLRRWGSDLAGGPRGGTAPAAGRRAQAEATPAEDLQDDAHVTFELEGFKYLRATRTSVLLQLAGYWRADSEQRLDAPTLLIHDGRRMHRLAPLVGPNNESPTAGPDSPLWRGSYAAPIEIFERRGRIAIQGGTGAVVGLPNPDEVRASAQPEVAARNGVPATEPAPALDEPTVSADAAATADGADAEALDGPADSGRA